MRTPAPGGHPGRAAEIEAQSFSTASAARRHTKIDAFALYHRCHELLAFDPEAGSFRWRVARGAVRIGRRAGGVGSCGRRFIKIDGRAYRADALGILLTTGTWPDGVVLHINGHPADDALGNLRAVPSWAMTDSILATLPAWAPVSLRASWAVRGWWRR